MRPILVSAGLALILVACQAATVESSRGDGGTVPADLPAVSSAPDDTAKDNGKDKDKAPGIPPAPASFAITLDTYTNAANPEIAWTVESGLVPGNYLLKLASSDDCEASFIFYQLADTKAALEHLIDGAYYVCLYAVAADGSLISAKNNVLRFVIDRAAPAVELAEETTGSGSVTVDVSVEDASPTKVEWRAAAGSEALVIDSPESASTRVSASAPGRFEIEAVVTDAASNVTVARGAVELVEPSAVPVNAPVGVGFTDTDPTGGKIGGVVTITKAASELDVTHYALYWGSSATTKQSSMPLAVLPKTGANLTSTLPPGTDVPSSPVATHLLVYSRNADGEMAAGVAVLIVDLGVPVHAATSLTLDDLDKDAGEIEGTLTIGRAADETDLTHYVLYWGTDATTKESATALATIAKTETEIEHDFGANSAVPATASHLLVYTANADGEMATPFASTDFDKARQVFSFTGAAQTLVVPASVTSLTIKAWGAGGGTSSHAWRTGGGGGFVSTSVTVTPGETLSVIVGGGGAFGNRGSSGGGRSALVRGVVDLATAAGGGGAGCLHFGGAGGGETGQDGDASPSGTGATQVAGGVGGIGNYGNGSPGIAYEGGAGSLFYGFGPVATFGGGGRGGECTGGGGGGYFGGGGGARKESDDGGGGGGSSYVPPGGTTEGGNQFTPGGIAEPDYQGSVGYGARNAINGNLGYDGLVVINY